jgi:hypothetical protein
MSKVERPNDQNLPAALQVINDMMMTRMMMMVAAIVCRLPPKF